MLPAQLTLQCFILRDTGVSVPLGACTWCNHPCQCVSSPILHHIMPQTPAEIPRGEFSQASLERDRGGTHSDGVGLGALGNSRAPCTSDTSLQPGCCRVLAKRLWYAEELVNRLTASLSRARPALWAPFGCGVSSARLEAGL